MHGSADVLYININIYIYVYTVYIRMIKWFCALIGHRFNIPFGDFAINNDID